MENTVLTVALILFFGICSQWLAWRLGVPSILFLLLSGLIGGPVLNIISPDKMLGDLLFPLVSISVAILIFEGALHLKFTELRKIGSVLRNLLTIGVLLTSVLIAVAAHIFLGMNWHLALLLGVILAVTGPTVIAPLLRSLSISPKLDVILRWEGIMIDPIGALLAVFIFEMFFGSFELTIWNTVITLFNTMIVGICLGYVAGNMLLQFIRYELIPDFLQNPFTLMFIITVYSLSNLLEHESALLTVTVMGLVMANQDKVPIKKISEFNSNLQVLLIASLFILLSARIDAKMLDAINWMTVFFVLTLIFIVRPVSVLFSSLGTRLKFKEILFLSAIAPRGIVAAAISSFIALELNQSSHPGGDILVTTVFIVIFVSGIITTIITKPLSSLLGLKVADPRGLLFLGAHEWARELAVLLRSQGQSVLLVDVNSYNVEEARNRGLKAINANLLEEGSISRSSLSDIGYFLALTSNDEVNSLVSLSFKNIISQNNIYQLNSISHEGEAVIRKNISKEINAKILFSKELNFSKITLLYNQGWKFHSDLIIDEHSYEEILHKKSNIYPLLFHDKGELTLCEAEQIYDPKIGLTLVSLVAPIKEA